MAQLKVVLLQGTKFTVKTGILGGLFYGTYINDVWSTDNTKTIAGFNRLIDSPHLSAINDVILNKTLLQNINLAPELPSLPSLNIKARWNSGVTKTCDFMNTAPSKIKSFFK